MTVKPKLAVIGGGTGSFVLLSALKDKDYALSALVNMVDSGGSTGQLRDEYGVLPPGDVRQCLVALSDAPMSLRNLFNFRFPGDSSLGGHSFGNLFLSAVEMMTDNFSEAVKMASNALNIKGRVIPITTEKCQLVMDTDEGRITGEGAITNKVLPRGVRPSLSLGPKARINPEAEAAIAEADLIVIAPGNLYSSIIPALLVEGMPSSLKKAKAPLVFVSNLVNKPNNTFDFKVSDYVHEIEKYIGESAIDYVLYNIDIPSEELLKKYAQEDEYPVTVDQQSLNEGTFKPVAGNFLSHQTATQDKDDNLKRSLLRHNGQAVADTIISLIETKSGSANND